MKFILLQLLWDGRKIAQYSFEYHRALRAKHRYTRFVKVPSVTGQTEPVGVTRRRTWVRREVKFVQNTRHYKKEFVK